MNKARLMPIVVVVAIGIVLGGLILTLDKPSVVTTETEQINEKESENQPSMRWDNSRGRYDLSRFFEKSKRT